MSALLPLEAFSIRSSEPKARFLHGLSNSTASQRLPYTVMNPFMCNPQNVCWNLACHILVSAIRPPRATMRHMQCYSSVVNVALLEEGKTGAHSDCMGAVLKPAGAPSVSFVAGSLSQLSWQSSAHFRPPRCSGLLWGRQALKVTCAHVCAFSQAATQRVVTKV